MSRWVPHKIDNISKEKGVIPSRGSGHGKGHSFSRNVHIKMLGSNWEVIYRVIEKCSKGPTELKIWQARSTPSFGNMEHLQKKFNWSYICCILGWMRLIPWHVNILYDLIKTVSSPRDKFELLCISKALVGEPLRLRPLNYLFDLGELLTYWKRSIVLNYIFCRNLK